MPKYVFPSVSCSVGYFGHNNTKVTNIQNDARGVSVTKYDRMVLRPLELVGGKDMEEFEALRQRRPRKLLSPLNRWFWWGLK